MTLLGTNAIFLTMVILIVLVLFLMGAHTSNDEEPSNHSFWRLHEAFHGAFSKLVSQTMFFVFTAALLMVLNTQVIHSKNMEFTIGASLVGVVIWVSVGIFLIYYAQG